MDFELGLLIVFGNQVWVLFEKMRAVVGRSAALRLRLYDGLAETSDRAFLFYNDRF